MSAVKDFVLKCVRAAWKEYSRVDRTCNNCRREIFGGATTGEKLFCRDCYEHLPFNNGFICSRCGRCAVFPTDVCDDCRGIEVNFTKARSVFRYDPPINKLIRSLKYDNRRYLAKVFSYFLSEKLLEEFPDAEVITFSPMAGKTKRKRGFNQSELLARYVAKETNLPLVDMLEKERETEQQVHLGMQSRLTNLKGAIKVRNKALVKGKTIVIIDDVITTGATVDACSRVLKSGGAAKVYVLTVASVTDEHVARLLGHEISGR